MKSAILKIEPREEKGGGRAKSLRQSGYIPSVLYGKDIKPVSVKIKISDFRDSLKKNGRNAVYNVSLGSGKEYSVVVHDVQYDPIKNDIMHIDFQQVSLTETRKAEVPIRIIGRERIESDGNMINLIIDIVEVECLPQDTPEAFDVDVNGMKDGDTVLAGQINIPANVTLLTDPDEAVVKISEPRATVEPEDGEDADADSFADDAANTENV